jgi:hypothetical protein
VQETALVEVQLTVALPPLEIELGLADKLIVGALAALTVTITDCVAVPPGPEHVNE